MVDVYGSKGVWMWYDFQDVYAVLLISEDVRIIARTQAQNKYGSVGFWPFGMDIKEAVEWWEDLG